MTTEPLTINPNGVDRIHLADAAEHYCKRLDGLGSAAAKVGRTQDEAKYTAEAAKWREELVTPVREGGEVAHYYPRHMSVLEQGCILMAHNMKAAKGTMKPFGIFDDVGGRLEAASDYVLNSLSVLFTPIMAGQAADDAKPEKVDRECPSCGETFTTAADTPADQECVKCLAKRGEEPTRPQIRRVT